MFPFPVAVVALAQLEEAGQFGLTFHEHAGIEGAEAVVDAELVALGLKAIAPADDVHGGIDGPALDADAAGVQAEGSEGLVDAGIGLVEGAEALVERFRPRQIPVEPVRLR